MKKTLLFAAILGAAPLPALAQQAPARARPAATSALPVFDFLGQNTESPSTMTMLGKRPCETRANAIKHCDGGIGPDVKIGDALLLTLSMSYHNERLFLVQASTIAGYYPMLAMAFRAKYGEPDALENRKWQNRLGMTFDNHVLIWKFKGGELELRERGDKSDESVFEFVSTPNAPPVKTPQVNF